MSCAAAHNEQAVYGCCRYFEEDDEESTPALAYIPAPGSPTRLPEPQEPVRQEDDDDPLDAYMAGIERQVYFMFYEINILLLHFKNFVNVIFANIEILVRFIPKQIFLSKKNIILVHYRHAAEMNANK